MKRVFQKLQASGLLERTPGKKGSASTWQKPLSINDKNGEQMSLF